MYNLHQNLCEYRYGEKDEKVWQPSHRLAQEKKTKKHTSQKHLKANSGLSTVIFIILILFSESFGSQV